MKNIFYYVIFLRNILFFTQFKTDRDKQKLQQLRVKVGRRKVSYKLET